MATTGPPLVPSLIPSALHDNHQPLSILTGRVFSLHTIVQILITRKCMSCLQYKLCKCEVEFIENCILESKFKPKII
jgi:hypothetical protein